MTKNPTQSVSSVLLIDDDPQFCSLLKDYFDSHAIRLICAPQGQLGITAMREMHFDIILLDMFLPDIHGIEVLRQIRLESKIPVIILSAHNEETDRIVTLELGADDYVPKKYSARELLARIRAVLRRQAAIPATEAASEEQDILRLRGLVLNDRNKEAFLDGKPLDLTAMEFRLLWAMVSSAGKVFSRENLLSIVAERNFNKYDRSVDVHVVSLRHKLGDDSKSPKYIKTMRGIGYSILR